MFSKEIIIYFNIENFKAFKPLFFPYFFIKRELFTMSLSSEKYFYLDFDYTKMWFIYIFMFENMTHNFSFLAFVVVTALYFWQIFLKFRTFWSFSFLVIFSIIRSIFIMISYLSNTCIWVLKFHILIEFISIFIKAFFWWIIIFFNCYLALVHRLKIWSAFRLILEKRLLSCSVY